MQHAVLDCSRSTKGKPFFLHAAKVGIASYIKSKTKIDSYQGEKKFDQIVVLELNVYTINYRFFSFLAHPSHRVASIIIAPS